ncbi:MAG: MFS transporter [Gammaproteobacteria bacterium]|nr:MFS transporter [Gammaproteobacteria bacterium]
MEACGKQQPRGLVILFLTEIWERYGFYTIQTLLLLYLVHELGFNDKDAYRLFSGFSALLYGTQVIGGYLADRVLGFQRAVIYGSILHIIGFLLLATPGEVTMMIGLGTLSCGAGFFKPNVSSLLGTFYGREDHRRDSGFTIFYMGINIGIFMAVISAYIGHHYGFHAGFAAAALAMTMSLLTFVFGRRRFLGHGDQPLYQDHAHQQFSIE